MFKSILKQNLEDNKIDEVISILNRYIILNEKSNILFILKSYLYVEKIRNFI